MSDTQVRERVEKAEEDYRAALALDAADVASVVCFHSQQCVEKYLKAALAAQGQRPPRIHDVIALNEMLTKRDVRFAAVSEELLFLTPYSVMIRYPGGKSSPREARTARNAMKRTRAKIRSFLGLAVNRQKRRRTRRSARC